MSINDYRIQRVIGKGSFATVFKGVDRKTQQPVAIKIFTRRMSKQEQQLARKQVSISRTIDHPNIIKMYNQFRRNDTWYMVFQYCGKGDLQKLVRKGTLRQELVALLAVELVEAVFYLAENNIAHRDIKPANILLTDSFEVKLADLGFAKAVHHQEDFLKSYAGTPLIMAPEIFENGKYTNKCDIWSLGVIFYQLLCGTVPFLPKRGGIEELVQLVKNAKLQFPKDIQLSAEARDLVLKCLEKNPEKRASAAQLRTHPWIVRARQHRNSLPQMLSALYSQQSRIFDASMQEEQVIDDTRIFTEINNSLKRMLDGFTQSYQQSVEKFHKSYRVLSTLFKERCENGQAISQLQQFFGWKCLEIQRFHLTISLMGDRFELNAQEFVKPKIAVDQLRKLLPLDFVLKENVNMNAAPRNLIKITANLFEKHAAKMGPAAVEQATLALSSLLSSTYDNYTITAKVFGNLPRDLAEKTARVLKDISRQDILRMIAQKKTELSIALIDVLDVQVQLPPSRLPPNTQSNLQSLVEALTQKSAI